MPNILDVYEDVEDFLDKIESLKFDIPRFENTDWCEDYINDIISLCNEWLDEHQSEYQKARYKEQLAIDEDYERSKL